MFAALAMAAVCTSTFNRRAPSRQNRPWIEIQIVAPTRKGNAKLARPVKFAAAPMRATKT